MIKLRYIGKEEMIPALGDRWVRNGEVVPIHNHRIANTLLKTMRWEKANKPVVKPKPVEKPKDEPKTGPAPDVKKELK